MDQYSETFETWNKIAKQYEDKFMDLELYNNSYDNFIELLNNKDACILEIGCGPGNITRYLLNSNPGYCILGTDVSPNMIELARKNNPAARFIVADCRMLDEFTRKFDAVISGFAIPYLSKEDTAKLLKDLHSLLHENGIIYISFVEGNYNDSGYLTGSSGDRTFFYYHEPSIIEGLLEDAGFNLVEKINMEYTKSDNSLENHIILIGRKL